MDGVASPKNANDECTLTSFDQVRPLAGKHVLSV